MGTGPAYKGVGLDPPTPPFLFSPYPTVVIDMTVMKAASKRSHPYMMIKPSVPAEMTPRIRRAMTASLL